LAIAALTRTTGTALGASSLNADLAGISASFDLIHHQLTSLDTLRAELEAKPGWSPVFEETFERYTTDLLQEMRALSVRSAELKARSLADLRVTARIYMERAIPDPQDDVACLAASICDDISALAEQGLMVP